MGKGRATAEALIAEMDEKLTFEEFKKALADEVERQLKERGSEAVCSIMQVAKYNNKVYDAMSINIKGEISPLVNLHVTYEKYLQSTGGDGNIGNIAGELLENQDRIKVPFNVDVEEVVDYEKAKKKILPRLINGERNSMVLAERPHLKFEDLAITYFVHCGTSEAVMASIPITNSVMEMYNLDVEELNKIAMANSQRDFPSKCWDICDMMEELIDDREKCQPCPKDSCDEQDANMEQENAFTCGGDFGNQESMGYCAKSTISAEIEEMKKQERKLYVITNDDKMNGAVAMLDSAIMDKMAEKLGGDFYILPSSIHEVMVVPAGVNQRSLEELREMVREVNTLAVVPEERLSDNVYRYSAKDHRARIAYQPIL